MSADAQLALIAEFGITAEQAKPILQRLRANSVPERLLGVFVNRREKGEPIAYYAIKELGRGTFGRVYSASTDGSHVPTVVIKRFNFPERHNPVRDLTPDESEEDEVAPVQQSRLFGAAADALSRFFPRQEFGTEQADVERTPPLEQVDLEREFRISGVIHRRLGKEFCRERVVCAVSRFYSYSRLHGFIVFPYRDVIPFGSYLSMYLHKPMLALEMRAFNLGLPSSDVGLQRAGTPEALDMLDQLRRLQLIAITQFRHLLFTVSLLHSKGIFHKDLNPANVVVTDAGVPLLIDFGIACVAGIAGDAEYLDREQRFLKCAPIYQTTEDYEDPLASTMKLENEQAKVDAYGKFDTYAIGKIGQLIFDPDILAPNGRNRDYPVVRQRPLMPRGLYELLVAMTGEQGYKPSVTDHGYDLKLTDQQRRDRIDRLALRVTTDVAVIEFNRIFQRWASLGQRRQ